MKVFLSSFRPLEIVFLKIYLQGRGKGPAGTSRAVAKLPAGIKNAHLGTPTSIFAAATAEFTAKMTQGGTRSGGLNYFLSLAKQGFFLS